MCHAEPENMMDQLAVVETLKTARSSWPMGLPEQIACSRGEKFQVSVVAPRGADLAAVMLSACIPAFYADEAVYSVETQVRPTGRDRIPLDEDAAATPALLVVFSDRSGQRDWWLCPYGVGDDGTLVWMEPGNLSSPEIGELLLLLDAVYDLGDCREEKRTQLYLLHENNYNVAATRSALE